MSFSKEFAKSVSSEFASLGLRRVVPFEHPDYAVYFRRENDEIGWYVIVRDARTQNKGVYCDFWFAALDLPDDGIATANLGLRITIYRDWAFDDQIVDGIVKRIKLIAGVRGPLIRAAQEELRSPAFQTKRGLMILETTRVVALLRESREGSAAWTQLLQLLKEKKLSVFVKIPEWNDVDPTIGAQCNGLADIAFALDKAISMNKSFLARLFYQRAMLLSA